MKKITLYILFIAISCVAFQSCKKTSPGDNYNFSNSIPPYVTLSSKAITVKTGVTTANVGIAMRTSLEQAVTVTYNVTGIVTASNQTIVIAKEALTTTATVTRASAATTGTANFTIVKAVKADGTPMTIGQDNVAANQVAVITFN